jgi:GGDEF domain-containing protein
VREGHTDPVELGPGAAAEVRALAHTIDVTTRAVRAHTGALQAQAHTDALTGLANRAALTAHLERRIAESTGRLAALFVDLDDFKVVNDSFGHAAGDELLRAVAGRLRASTGDCELTARLGGDEFAVVLDCGGDATEAARVAEASWLCSATRSRWAAPSCGSGAASAWPSPSTVGRRTSWCATPTSPCTGPRGGARTASTCSTRRGTIRALVGRAAPVGA